MTDQKNKYECCTQIKNQKLRDLSIVLSVITRKYQETFMPSTNRGSEK